jgi:hypothetical protein
MERRGRVDWEQVWQGTSEVEAETVAGRLEADGFRTLVRGNAMPERTIAFMRGAWGVAVPAVSAEAARESLRSNGEGHNIIEPTTGAGLTSTQKETLMFIVLGLLVLIGTGLVYAIKGEL